MSKSHVTVKAEAMLAARSFALALTTWAEARPSVASPVAPLSNVVRLPHYRRSANLPAAATTSPLDGSPVASQNLIDGSNTNGTPEDIGSVLSAPFRASISQFPKHARDWWRRAPKRRLAQIRAA